MNNSTYLYNNEEEEQSVLPLVPLLYSDIKYSLDSLEYLFIHKSLIVVHTY